LLKEQKMSFADDSDVENTHMAVVGPRYYVTTTSPEDLPTTFFTRPFRQNRRSLSPAAVSQLIDNKDAIQEYGRVIKKRGRLHGSGSSFLYEPHLFGHDVLFPAPMHSNPLGRKASKGENGAKREITAAPAAGVKSPEMVLPGKFRIMK